MIAKKIVVIVRKLHIVLVLAVLTAFLPTGLQAASRRAEKVLVIHSYDESGQEGRYFQKKIKHDFRRRGIKAEIRHFYFDLIYDIYPQTGKSRRDYLFQDEIISFKPDVLLINDDAAFHYILDNNGQLIRGIPTVFSGVNDAEWDKSRFPLICGFVDEVDLEANREISKEIFDIDNPAIVPSEDNHETISKASTSYGYQIQAAFDIYSNAVINLCDIPQITAIREQFNPEGATRSKHGGYPRNGIKFLGGYFTGIETQIRDQVESAVRILSGESPAEIGVNIHEKGYYLDWNAMRLIDPPLKYKDFKSKFQIVNIPFWRPFRTLAIILAVVLTLFFCYFLTRLFIKIWKINQARKFDIIQAMSTERKRRTLSMRGMEAEFFTIQNHLFRFYFAFTKRHNVDSPYYTVSNLRKWVDPVSMSNFNSIINDSTKIKKDRRTRIRMNIAGEGYHWWDVYYRVSDSLKDAFSGVLIMIDELVEDEEKVKANVKLAEEVASKEYFIANITHDIRTPLNAVAGLSQIMVDGCTAEEAAEYSSIISDNADQMLNLIDDAVASSLDDVDNIANYRISPVDIAKVATRSYNTNLVMVPPYLQFIFEEDNNGKPVMVNADIYYLNRVINNLINNAFKYTPQGSVTFGWKLVESGNKVEIYVRDTGIGIDAKDQDEVFERFFTTKNNLAGTGLGLYITKRIIDNLGGSIKLDSSLGAGSTFSCILPVIKEGQG